MSYDGIQYGQRVDGTTERKLHAKIVDIVLLGATYFSRVMGMGKPLVGKTFDITTKITASSQFQFVTGLEQLNSAAENNTITLSYAQAAGTQPEVSIMLESFANTGATATIDLDAYKYEEAAAELMAQAGSTIYGTGTGGAWNGLGNMVLDSGTIGGQARATYTQLNATVTSWSTTLTLAKMATLDDTISSASISTEKPNIGVTTKAVLSLYEQLLTPNVRASFSEVGYPAVQVRGNGIVKRSELKNGAGFTGLSYRSFPIISDDYATAGYMYFLNERKFDWMGRSIVPDKYKAFLKKVNLGTGKAMEGTGASAMELPSEYNGWFHQESMMMPTQAGTIARFWLIGQLVGKEFRRLGVGTGVTAV
jgi:hypothetical protein